MLKSVRKDINKDVTPAVSSHIKPVIKKDDVCKEIAQTFHDNIDSVSPPIYNLSMCENCMNECKIAAVKGARMVKCPDFKAKQ